MSVLAVFLLACLFFPFLVTAGIPEKYGEECTTSDSKRYYKVKFSVKNNPVLEKHQVLPESEYTYVQYYLDGTVEWIWKSRLAEGYINEVKGTRIDDAGSFRIKAGDIIGAASFSTTRYLREDADISIYPMMQYEGMNILLTHLDDIIFRVDQDELIRMEHDHKNLPSNAKIGFGPIYSGYYYIFKDDPMTRYDYGPEWQMLLDFSMKPLYPKQDAVDEVIDDAAETDTPFYDILGQRVGTDKNNLTPGIYIYKGKKILVK